MCLNVHIAALDHAHIAATTLKRHHRPTDSSFALKSTTHKQDADFARSFNPRPDPALSLSHLLLGFFHFYGHVFNPATSVLSVRLARLLDKKVRI